MLPFQYCQIGRCLHDKGHSDVLKESSAINEGYLLGTSATCKYQIKGVWNRGKGCMTSYNSHVIYFIE